MPLNIDIAAMGRHVEELLGPHPYGDELYGVRYALQHPNNPELVQRYLCIQELTHVQEGARLRQRDSREFDMVDGHALSNDGKTMVQVARDGLHAQERAVQADNGFDFMVVRNVHDVEIAVDNDARMLQLPVGSCWARVTPFAEEESIEDAEQAGFDVQRRRAFLWIYRKASQQSLEATIVSLDQSDVRAFAGLMHEHGVDLPAGTTSHDIPGYVIEFNDLVPSESDRNNLVDDLTEQYHRYAGLVEASGIDLTSKEFIERYSAADILSLVRLQQEIKHSLLLGKVTDFLEVAISAVLDRDYLNDMERQLMRRLLRAEKLLPVDDLLLVQQQIDTLRLVIKAHRVGVWKGINEKIKKLEAGQVITKQPYVAQTPTYVVGGNVQLHDIAQMQQNSQYTQQAADRYETMPGCSGGAGFLSQRSEEELLSDTFTTERSGQKKWMSCPFCEKKDATYDDPCAKELSCKHCKAQVKNGKVVSRGNGGKESPPAALHLKRASSTAFKSPDVHVGSQPNSPKLQLVQSTATTSQNARQSEESHARQTSA